MKYSKASLIEQARGQILTLKAEIQNEEIKFEKELKKWRADSLAEAKRYLAEITAWQTAPADAPRPDGRVFYAPSKPYHINDEGSLTARIAKLEQFVRQIKLSSEETIEFKNGYDKQLLDILTK